MELTQGWALRLPALPLALQLPLLELQSLLLPAELQSLQLPPLELRSLLLPAELQSQRLLQLQQQPDLQLEVL